MARDIYVTAAKLKALAESPNAHEAARARETFRAFTKRHRIREEDLVLPPTSAELLRLWEEQQRAIQAMLDQLERMRQAATAERPSRVPEILARHGARLVRRRERERRGTGGAV